MGGEFWTFPSPRHFPLSTFHLHREDWILSTQFLWDPVDLGSRLEKKLLPDPGNPGSCSKKMYWLRWVVDHYINKLFDGRCGSAEFPVTFFVVWRDTGDTQAAGSNIQDFDG